MTKCLQIINSCNGCPNKRYYSGGAYECSALSVKLPDGVTMPAWCPLPEHPAKIAARAEAQATLGRNAIAALVNECAKAAPNVNGMMRVIHSAADRMGIDIPQPAAPDQAQDPQEVVAWAYELATDLPYETFEPRLSRVKPSVPEGSIRNLRALGVIPTPDEKWRAAR